MIAFKFSSEVKLDWIGLKRGFIEEFFPVKEIFYPKNSINEWLRQSVAALLAPKLEIFSG